MSDDNDHDHDDDFEPSTPEEYQEYIRNITVVIKEPMNRESVEESADIPEVVDALKLPSNSKPKYNPAEDGNKSRKTLKGLRKRFPSIKTQLLSKTPSSLTKSTRKTTQDGIKNSTENVKKIEKIKDSKEGITRQNEKPPPAPAPPSPKYTIISRSESPKPLQRPLQKTNNVSDEVEATSSSSSSTKEKKTSLGNRTGKYLRSRIGPRPTILTAIPQLAPLKSGNPEEIHIIMKSQPNPTTATSTSINANDSVGFISSGSGSSKNRSTQDVMSISNDNKPKSPGSPGIPVEELFMDLLAEKDGHISDINSAISLMVRQREFLQHGEIDHGTSSQDSLPNSSQHSMVSKSKSKESSSQAGKLFHMNVITKDNFQKVRWSDAYEHLAIKGCLRHITNENISRSRKTLTAIKFVQMTSFLNIKLILENCSNLVRLSFANVAVVQKSYFNTKTLPVISLPHLEEIELQEWLYALTKYEYWVLDFLNRGCSFGKLEKFVFQGRESVMDEKKSAKYQKQLKGITDPAVVTKFMIKNSSTLKKVAIGGIGFQLLDSPITRYVNQLNKIQLNSFRFDLQTPGVEYILLGQRKLQTLSCTGFLQSFELRAKQWINQSLDNNYLTLTFLGIFPCIISEVHADKRSSLYTIDCDMFRRCKKLESLFLNITTVYRKTHTERFSCGRIINIHLLPVGLVEIELYAMRFQEQDIDDLCKRLPMFRRLRELILNSTTQYTLSAVLISNLPLVDSLHSAKFFGGRFDDPDTMQRIVKKRGVYTMTVGEGSIQLVKNESAHPSMLVSFKSSVSDKKIVIK